MPFLSIRRRPALEMRRRTQRFSLSTQKRRYCRFTSNRRLVLLLAWETLFPTIGPLPVTSQTRAMEHSIKSTAVTGGRTWVRPRDRLTSPSRVAVTLGAVDAEPSCRRQPSQAHVQQSRQL